MAVNGKRLVPGLQHDERQREAGGALIELALVMPLLMGLVLGTFTIGLSMITYVALTSAVGAGAQALALSRGSSGVADPCAAAVSAVYKGAPMLAQSNLVFTVKWTAGQNTTTYTGSSALSCPNANLTAGAQAQLAVTYPGQLFFFGYRPRTFNMTASTVELVQ